MEQIINYQSLRVSSLPGLVQLGSRNEELAWSQFSGSLQFRDGDGGKKELAFSWGRGLDDREPPRG